MTRRERLRRLIERRKQQVEYVITYRDMRPPTAPEGSSEAAEARTAAPRAVGDAKLTQAARAGRCPVQGAAPGDTVGALSALPHDD